LSQPCRYNRGSWHHNRDRIDSLKMAALYRSSTWGDTEAGEHQKEMIALLQSYLATAPESLNPSATH